MPVSAVYRRWFRTMSTMVGLLASGALCAVSLPSIISDNMVIQSGVPVPVWGRAFPGEKITVVMGSQSADTIAGNDSTWRVDLKPVKAGGPYTMTVKASNTLTVKNILAGEVWLCSGQSNMEMTVVNSADAQREIARAQYPLIRMFTVEKAPKKTPQNECSGAWEICSPKTVGRFSAVGYFFGRELHNKLQLPVGLINSSWGGTPAESWTTKKTLSVDTMFKPIVTRFDSLEKAYPRLVKEYGARLTAYEKDTTHRPIFQSDRGNQGLSMRWASDTLPDRGWMKIELPALWEEKTGLDIDGALWFRKKIALPKSWRQTDLALSLGPIDDFDITYVNGVVVGQADRKTPDSYALPRLYLVPAGTCALDTATVAVRVFDHFGGGGFGGSPQDMWIAPATRKGKPLPIAGQWKFMVETALSPRAVTGPGARGIPHAPMDPELSPHRPGALYNGMIHPLLPFTIRGAIWYQGEQNAGRAYQYRKLLPAMIRDWRTVWKQPAMPFGIVQLANFMHSDTIPVDSDWPELREAQFMTAAADSAAGLAVTIDIGDSADIHPKNKQDVGKRLSFWALATVYGKKLEHSGPVFSLMAVDSGKAVLEFTHADSLVIKGANPSGFTIAGADRKFVWAEAAVTGKNRVVVRSDKVAKPVAVRYGWANNPQCNLYNQAGLPMVPFRTDTWPGVTANTR